MERKKFLLTLVLGLLFPASVQAATITVSPGQSIQNAVNAANSGDTITVNAGTYNERVNVTKSNLSFQAQGKVIMKGFKIIANYITIKDFEIANTDYVRWNTQTSSGIYIKGAYNLVENNYIHDSALDAINLFGTPADPTTTHDNTIKNNRLYHNEMAGIVVNGRNNTIEGNEVWGSVQCHPNLTKVEDLASDNNGQKCPNYPALGGLDADGMRFFGQGHIFRNNKIHDIRINPPETVTPHIDCFQTWANTYSEVAKNILFEQNYCENLNQGMYVYMLAGDSGKTVIPSNITIKNNTFKAYGGVNTGGGVDYLYIYNNIFANNLSFYEWAGVIGLDNVAHATVKNNIFYDQPYHTVTVIGNTTNIAVDNNLAFNSNGSTPHCVQWGNYDTCQPTPNHELWNVNPQFINPSGEDFHLQSGSLACTGGENGTYIGAFPCVGGNAKPGDSNNDNKVDGVDYVVWLSHYNQSVSGPANGDFNNSGGVDGVDYVIWVNNYGK